MEHKFRNSNAEVKTIKGIQFGVISPDFIRKISVTQSMEFGGKEIKKGITIDNCYDQATGLANIGAINDPRMGNTADLEHPGYFGHIDLVRPVYHIGFLKIVIDILKCVSHYTSELLVSRDNYVSKKGKRNLKDISHAAKSVKKCPTTDKKIPSYTKEGTKIGVDYGQGKEILSPEEVYHILEKISDVDAQILGFNPEITRPEWLLLKTIPVPPLHVRPSVFMSSSQKCDDDLTTKLNEIVKTNIALSNAIEKQNQDQSGNTHYISQLEALLQYNINTFIDNQHPGQPPSLQRSGKPLKTLRERLAGKDGRVRGNLMGKRVDFSARTVITADPNLSIDEVGVPINIAKNLTVPETVTNYNKEYLFGLVKNGPFNYPGAKFIIRNGTKIDLKVVEIKELKNGWVVERHLSDGDLVLFNRQPSLHKMSIMGHKVKVLNESTFRLNLACTSPYNADFDGDEMNLHVPQSLTARAEVENLMMVDKLIVSPQSNKPVIGIIQDSLLSSCKMSRRNIIVKKNHVMNILTIIGWEYGIPTPAIIRNNKDGTYTEYWTGKQLLSLIIPTNLHLNNLKDPMNPHDKGILIINGQILSGSVDKAIIGKSQGGLIHTLFNDYGPGTTKTFLNIIQKLSNYWIKQHGFTIGIGDAIPNKETIEDVKKILSDMKEKIKLEVENNNNKDTRVIEEFINSELNAAVSEAGKKAEESLNFDNNNFKATVQSGSKGSSINISQIMAAVGQQNVEGRRINYGFKGRTLPHYDYNDIGQESRGFVENSYVSGLTPQEFFFHAMAGREGLIDTACKSVSGCTEILVMENGKTRNVKIGEWIDEYMEKNKEKVEKRPEHQDTEVIDFLETEEVFMPTTDKYGNTSWGRVTHLTRHDPGELVYEVKTQSGRSVKVVESKSLIVWNGKTFEKKLTSETKIGEYLPVTMKLDAPNEIHNYVDMEKYFPKTEYIYGTEYNNAISMMEDSMKDEFVGDRSKIPRGWWEENNRNKFTLPYTKKSSLQRSKIRSSPLKNGCIYPYGASRDCGTEFCDKFKMDKNNGIFIGLFLAEGHARIKEGSVDIANNDPEIRDFIKKWFETYKIRYSEYTREIPQENGNVWTSSTVRGYSTILSKFLHIFLGHMSHKKYVPNEAFNAPDEFVLGLLNGYFSGDGSVRGNMISSGSVSKRLMYGISHLCSRFGIFGKIIEKEQKLSGKNNIKNIQPYFYTFSINGQWSKIFAKNISLIEKNKQVILNNILEQGKVKEHINYKTQNDVVMDPIISIELLDPIGYPKVYDVTIPSTDNFQGFNGINFSNTSETGYIQRRLVKALEDISVKYDRTVRNSKGLIVQFLYGEDGIDATYMENVHIKMLTHNFEELKQKYYNKEVPEEFEKIVEIHKEFIKIAKYRELNNTKQNDDYFPVAISLSRIIKYAENLSEYEDDDYMDDRDMYREVENLCTRISKVFEHCDTLLTTGSEKYRSVNATKLTTIYIWAEMATMKIRHLTKNQFLYAIEEIEFKFKNTIVQAGEMVGILAAQSIGEPRMLGSKASFKRVRC
jgi:DNA-directed RNA polymerase beta' subunit